MFIRLAASNTGRIIFSIKIRYALFNPITFWHKNGPRSWLGIDPSTWIRLKFPLEEAEPRGRPRTSEP